MPDRDLPTRPNLEQYKKQAKDLVKSFAVADPPSLSRIQRHHPRFHKLSGPSLHSAPFALTDSQLVIAREHGFESWPKFAHHIETLTLIRSLASLADPVSAFIEVACVPRHSSHSSGTLEHAEIILSRFPHVATSSIYTSAILANESAVRGFLSHDPKTATAAGGPYGWDALTHLCFSRYLKLDHQRSDAFVATARVLLDAGANANTGWHEMIDHPNPRPVLESAIYGAAGIARHPGLTRLLLDRGADPNDEETPYHVPETYDNTVMSILLESGKLSAVSLTTLLLRKTDWHDEPGLRLALESGADPNDITRWGVNALQHALRRDNSLKIIQLLLDHAADPTLKNPHDGTSATFIAAHRGRGDVLVLFEQRGVALDLHGIDGLIAACARADRATIASLLAQQPLLANQLVAHGGALLAHFAGNNNVAGLRCLLDLGISVSAPYLHGDPYFDIANNSTALHVAAWRAWPDAVQELLNRGAPVNALDGKGRTALFLAVKACVDSYWTARRSPDSVAALLRAGATSSGIEIPSGYQPVDDLLVRSASL